MVRIAHVIVVFTLLVAVLVFGARGAPSSPAMDADAAFQAQNWQQTAELYARVTKDNPKDAMGWFRLGYALVKLGRDKEALAAFDEAEKQGLPKPAVELGRALALARSDRDKAFEHLQAAAASGFNDSKRLANEDVFMPLHGDPRFAKVMDTVMHNEKPCLYAAESRQFDFWVGEWRVVQTGTDAPQVGTSHIDQIHNGCVILENWTSARSPYAGQSFNTYNSSLKRWEQFWVDNQGGTIFFYGQLNGNVMDYWTDDLPQNDGKKLRRHLQFFNLDANTMRQFSQGSNDGGKTWFVEYDFTYHRVGKHGDRSHTVRDAMLAMEPDTRL
jgi:tetratricopeptide (TPR) repeat protein